MVDAEGELVVLGGGWEAVKFVGEGVVVVEEEEVAGEEVCGNEEDEEGEEASCVEESGEGVSSEEGK